MDRLDSHNINMYSNEILAFATIRNEILRLPWLLQFYRKLGVNRFFIVDNNSSDGSTKYLLTQNDVHLFHTKESYAKANVGMDWINSLLKAYAQGKWALTIDADELFIFPGFEIINLKKLVSYLDSQGYDSVRASMIDMYSAKSIEDTDYQSGTDFLTACPYFDGDALTPDFRGGARKRLFWDNTHREANPPVLLKYPLIKWKKEYSYKVSTHIIEGVNVADITGALLHFKLFSDFSEKVTIAVEEGEHWQNASQYAVYLAGLQENSQISPCHNGSVRFENSSQLVEMGFMKNSSKFVNFQLL